MIFVGTDIVPIIRIENLIKKKGEHFLNHVYTKLEQNLCDVKYSPFIHYSGKFAAKEAVMKALGTGTRGVRWKDVEIIRFPGNAPIINLHSSALKRANQIGVKHFALSLSHSKEYAVASVVGESSLGNRLDD